MSKWFERSRRSSMVRRSVAALLLVAGLAGCTPSGGSAPTVPPTAPVWVVGDSLATGTGFSMTDPRPYVWGVGAAGFTAGANTTVLANTQHQIDTYGSRPRTMLAVGGVNDLAINASITQIESDMVIFETAMAAQGIAVVWVLEPAWSREAQLQPLYAWQRTRPRSIDCLAAKGPNMPGDGDHPFDYTNFGACVWTKLRAMPGVTIA